jgi:hypothetical protein
MRMIKSRRMRWGGHVARMRRSGMHTGFWWKRQKERDHYEGLDVGNTHVRMDLREIGWDGTD